MHAALHRGEWIMRSRSSSNVADGFKRDRQHCDSCGAAVQLGERSCPWCTTPYAADAQPEQPIEQTWDDDEDPSHGGGYWVGIDMARPQAFIAVEASGALTPNEIRGISRQWADAYSQAPGELTKPLPPPSRVVIDAPWPFYQLITWVKGLFK